MSAIPDPSRRDRRCAGTTLIEVALAGSVMAFALFGVASSFGSSARAVGGARGITEASRFVEEVLDAIAAQPFDNVSSLNGNVLYDHETPKSARYRVSVGIVPVAVGLLRIQVALIDNRSGQQVTKVVTYRSQR